ncbi:MAG TPA: M20/M25/M40 family metallo-hydrolase [Pyrinomonadaceae bacterium]|nr:M20/M25/M40 family metallo-hydrolase [Pyrinomonadaceae bacterium]
MKLRSLLIIALEFVFSVCVFAQISGVPISTEAELTEQLKLAPCKNTDRFDAAQKLFRQAGATDGDMTVDKMNKIQNLVVTKKGKSLETIIVGAHYDKVDSGCGAIDNWTGLVIIANLYRTMKDVQTEKTYLFVAFDKEEEGLIGSNAMAKNIPKETRPNYCAMVNFDSFGFGYPQVLDNTSTPSMIEIAEKLAKEINMQFYHASLSGTADADSSSFKDKGIPAVTFHGLSNDWQRYLHSSNDKFENLKISSVFVGYQFAIRYLVKLDAMGCGDLRK